MRGPFAKYSSAILFILAAVAVRWVLDPGLGDHVPLVTLYAAVAAAVWFGGSQAAIVTAFLGYFACDYLFIQPRGTFDFSSLPNLLGLLAYAVSCAIIIGFGEAMRSAQRNATARNELLQVTLSSIGDAVISTDTNGRVTFLNPVAERLTGWSQREASGRPLEDVFRIVNEQTRATVDNPVTKVLREGNVVGLANHTILVAKDGTERPIDDSAAPIRNQQGDVSGCVLVFRDVTEQRKAANALRQSERELADFFDNANIGLHWVGPDGIIQRVNKSELDMLGYKSDEYVGRPIAEFYADRRVIDDILARLLAGETLHEYSAQMRCKDGSIRDVLINSSGLFVDGKFVHSRCFTQDITDRKRADEAQARLAAIVEASDDAIVSKTLDGIVRSWNAGAARLFGYTASEAVGRSIELIIPAELRDEEKTILARLRRGERIDHFETVRVTKYGRRLDISLTVSPIRDSSGKIIGASKIARDITLRKRIELERAEEDRRKDEFIATLSHELRNPLAPIRNAVEILKSVSPADPKLKYCRDVIDQQTKLMGRLMEDLLDVSRITRDKIELRKEPLEVRTFLEQAVEISRPQIEAAGHSLTVNLPAESVVIEGDPARLTQVFANLLNNASKYTQRNGSILVRAALEPPNNNAARMLAVCVRDSGIGIAREKLPHIFDMFFQADGGKEHGHGGLGIGLTLARRLVALHGGTIEARSDGLNRGSEFIVRLPVSALEAPFARTERAGAEERVSARRTRIVIIDDNKMQAQTLMMLLEIKGYEVRMAHDGESGLQLIKEFAPQAALIDIGLPGTNGYEVARRLRGLEQHKDMLLIAQTGWGREQDREQSQTAGFNYHLAKPIDHDQLEKILGRADAAEINQNRV